MAKKDRADLNPIIMPFIDNGAFDPEENINLGVIQEEDLIHGGLAKTKGLLPHISFPSKKKSHAFTFLSIEKQYRLKAMRLMAHNQPVTYELSEHKTRLIAKQTHPKKTLFSAKLDSKGLYNFELHNPIDRPPQINLISPNFQQTPSALQQDIQTKSGKIYELSFYFKPIKNILIAQDLSLNKPLAVELWWAGLLIAVIQLSRETLQGYHFTLEGQDTNTKIELKIPELTPLSTQDIAKHLDMLTLVPEEQTQLKFELGFKNQLGIENYFPVLINLENQIFVSKNASYTIVIDDLSPYKKIVLSDTDFLFDNTASTTLNLEKIFTRMQIPEPHRQVDIAQLERSHIYEIKISDNSNFSFMPITVADIELKFNGGDSGLDTLFKYLNIYIS